MQYTKGAQLFHPEALNYVVGWALFTTHPYFHPNGDGFRPILLTHEVYTDAVKEVTNGVVHVAAKETINKYQKLIDDPLTGGKRTSNV